MVYLYNKKVGGKNNYYLRASKRVKTRVITKDIAYLGTNIELVKQKLNNLSEYKSEIKKSYRTLNKFIESEYYLKKAKEQKLKKNDYLSKELMEQLEAARIHYNKFLKKNSKTKDEVFSEFIISFVFNSNAIEGNTITLAEAVRLLKEDIAPKDKTIKEINDMKNSEKVFLWLRKTNDELSEELIIKIHDELLKNIDVREGYRLENIRTVGGGFKATPAPFIKEDMKLLIKFYKENLNINPLVLASIIHHKFEKIHPFYDGNGRTGRMIINYILLKNNYPLVVIRKKTRIDYLASLKKADKSGLTNKKPADYNNLVEYVSQELISTYWNIFLT